LKDRVRAKNEAKKRTCTLCAQERKKKRGEKYDIGSSWGPGGGGLVACQGPSLGRHNKGRGKKNPEKKRRSLYTNRKKLVRRENFQPLYVSELADGPGEKELQGVKKKEGIWPHRGY